MLLAACGGAAAADPANGQKLFTGEVVVPSGEPLGCSNCHALIPGEPASIGTNLSNIGNRASATVPGQSAEQYLRTAIIDPDAYLAGGFQEGIHPRTYNKQLTVAQVNDLVAFLLTLRSGQD
jgi:hypothetical protein